MLQYHLMIKMVLKRALRMNPKDNVATVIADIEKGDQIAAMLERDRQIVEAKEKIPFGFKIALTDIARDDAVYKYGEAIGKASKFIQKGYLVHIHNVEGSRGRGDLIGGENLI